MMRSDKDWARHYGHLGRRELARRIQVDTLRHAASICRGVSISRNMDMRVPCANDIEAEAKKLEAK